MLQATSVTAKGFKGLSFDQELSEKTLIIGPNGSGKSARALALILATRGSVPGVGKTNPDIVDAFCPGEELSVGYSVGDTFLERVYTTRKGSVSQTFRINGGKATKDDFQRKIGQTGELRPVDVSAFMALSDEKKLSALFDLYPPEGDVSKLTADIEKSKERYLFLEKKAREAKASAKTLLTNLSEAEAPPGTLEETRGEIETREEELEAARKELTEIETREEVERENEEKEKEAEAATEQLPPGAPPERGGGNVPESVATPAPSSGGASSGIMPDPYRPVNVAWDGKHRIEPYLPPPETLGEPLGVAYEEVCSMLEKIISIIDQAGCNACAARLVAVSELRKLKGGNGNGR